MNKYLKLSVAIASVISLLLLFIFCFFLFPVIDDTNLNYLISNDSVWNITYQFGINWDARILSPLVFFKHYLQKYLPHSIGAIFYLLIFFLNSYIVLFKFLKLKFNKPLNSFIFFSFFSLCVFYGLNTIVFQVIFWQSGGYYQLCLLVGLLWIILFDLIYDNLGNKYYSKLFILISIIAGTLTYNITICLVFYSLIKAYVNKKGIGKILGIGVLIILILNFLIMVSPGSLQRTNLVQSQISSKLVLQILRAAVHITIDYFSWSKIIIGFIFLFAFTIHLFSPTNIYDDYNLENIKNNILKSKFLLLALSSIIPFLIAPSLGSKRTALFFIIFIIIFFFQLFLSFLRRIIIIRKPLQNLSFMIMFSFFVYHIFTFSDHIYVAFDLKKQNNSRLQILSNAKRNNIDTVNLSAFKFELKDIPFSLDFVKETDINNDSNNQQIMHYKNIYNVKKIVVEKK